MLSEYYDAVFSQPDRLAQSAVSVSTGLEKTDLEPYRGGLFAVASMGASSHAATALVQRLVRHGGRAVNLEASEIMSLAPTLGLADSFLFVSEGGRSRETIAAAQIAPGGRRLALTNDPAAPLGEVTDAMIELGHGPDSKVYTVGYTATLQAFGLIARALDGIDDGDDWSGLPALVAGTLEALGERSKAVAARLAGLEALDFVGSGASYAAAAEGGLLFREGARMPTAAYKTHQYLHGPMEPMSERQGCLVFGDGREPALAQYLGQRGVTAVLVTTGAVPEDENLSVLRIPQAADTSRAVLEILVPQLLMGEAARLRGLGIDGFRYHQDDTKIDEVPV